MRYDQVLACLPAHALTLAGAVRALPRSAALASPRSTAPCIWPLGVLGTGSLCHSATIGRLGAQPPSTLAAALDSVILAPGRLGYSSTQPFLRLPSLVLGRSSPWLHWFFAALALGMLACMLFMRFCMLVRTLVCLLSCMLFCMLFSPLKQSALDRPCARLVYLSLNMSGARPLRHMTALASLSLSCLLLVCLLVFVSAEPLSTGAAIPRRSVALCSSAPALGTLRRSAAIALSCSAICGYSHHGTRRSPGLSGSLSGPRPLRS